MSALAEEQQNSHAGLTDPPTLPALSTDDFVELFRLHYPRVVRALILAGSSPGGAEDVAQEAFTRTFGRWRRVRRGSSPAGYVYRVAFRLLRRRDLVASTPFDASDPRSNASRRLDAPGQSSGVKPSGATAAESMAITSVDLERVLAAMPPRRRACAVLCFCLDFSPIEAGKTLGIASGTVRKQLDLARENLRAGLS